MYVEADPYSMIDKSVFLSAIESIHEGITLADASLPDCPIIYANEGFCTLTGYTREEVEGRNCRFLQGPNTDPAATAELSRALREKKDCKVELLNYRKDGTPFWNHVSIAFIKDDALNKEYVIGVQSDVSFKRELTEQQRKHIGMMRHHAEEMNRSLRILSNDIQLCMKALHSELASLSNAETLNPLTVKALQSITTTLTSNITLLATVLETNSNEILQYVKKRRA